MKLQFLVKNVKYHLANVKRLFSRSIHITNANMAVTLARFLSFLQNESKGIKRHKIITSLSTLRAAAM